MKVRYPSLVRVLVLFLIFCMFMAGFTVSSPKSSVMAQTTPDPGLDEYGGWKGLQGHNTTGHWTVELIGDRYWFITPDNNVLWDLTCLQVDGGESWQYSPLLKYSPTYLGNLAKYGGDLNAWNAAAPERLLNLGFSAIDYPGHPILAGMNVLVGLDHGYYQEWNSDEMNVPLLNGTDPRKFPDVFDERFRLLWHRTCQQNLYSLRGNSHVIAVNLGGELNWHGGYSAQRKTPDMFIEAPRTYACKQWWVNTFLKGRYASVQALNTAYGTTFASWDDLLDCSSIPDNTKYPAIVADKLDYTEAIAGQYYLVMTTEVSKILPDVLIFSERWGDWNDTPSTMPYNERIWKMAGKYCDVVSLQGYVNLSVQEEENQVVTRYAVAAGRPLMVTESSSFANDTAMRPVLGGGPVSDWTQMDRAKRYVDSMKWIYNFSVKGVGGNPTPVHVIMGRHWYKWYDDPPLGVSDFTGNSGEYQNWGIHDNQDEAYVPFADVMATVNKQSYAITTRQHPLIVPDTPTPVTPSDGTTTGDLVTFTWKAVPNARSYTLLVSPERAFPDAQTVRIDGIQQTSYTLTSPLAQGNWWWTVCAVENTYGFSGLYPDATSFRVKNDVGTLSATLQCERLNRVTFEDIWDAGGSASSYAFLDSTVKDQGNSSARCVFTEWAWNKTGAIGRDDSSIFIDTTGTTEKWTGVSLAIRPTSFCDTNRKLVPSSKYLRVRIWDQNGALFLEWPLDPEGKLPIGQWSTVTIPFGVLGPRSVSKVALTFVTEQDKLATDQRLTINVDKIVPVTETAHDVTAPLAPLITDMNISSGLLSVHLDATDPESGIGETQVCVGTTPGSDDLVPWTAADSDLVASVPLAVPVTSSWYVSAKAENGAGTWSAATTIDGSQWTTSTKASSIAAEHGSVSPAGTVLIPTSGTQTFSAIPDFGYAVQDIILDGVSAGMQSTVTVHGDGKSHSIVARFMFDKNAWSLDRLPAQVKTTLSMPIGSTIYQKNGTPMTLDVPPFINSGRTLVPARAISEGLGADVQWNAATHVVTVTFLGLDGTHAVSMTIGETVYSVDKKSARMEVAPVIVGGRTFVPLRAVSEALGAQVDWNADTKTVLVQGINATSMPLNSRKTLKGLYDAARTWDANDNGVDDSLEPFFLQQGATSQPACERTFKGTEVFARTDDTTATSELPALSTVVAIGIHNGLIKVRYSGQLSGYIATEALEKRTRDLSSVSDTDRWVLASGPSLQAFLNNAVATQWLGYLAPGQSLRVSDGAIVGASVGEDPFGFESDTMIDTPSGPFGIRFKLTRALNNLPSDTLDQRVGTPSYEPSVYFVGHRGINGGEWWNGFHGTEISLNGCLARDGASDQNHFLSDLALRSGQLYEIRFLDESGKTAIIALPDGTVLYTVDMSQLSWVKTGGCFPDHRLAVGLWIQAHSSMTVSDLAFVVPPTAPSGPINHRNYKRPARLASLFLSQDMAHVR